MYRLLAFATLKYCVMGILIIRHATVEPTRFVMGHLNCSERVVSQPVANSRVIQKSVFLAKRSTLAVQLLQSG